MDKKQYFVTVTLDDRPLPDVSGEAYRAEADRLVWLVRSGYLNGTVNVNHHQAHVHLSLYSQWDEGSAPAVIIINEQGRLVEFSHLQPRKGAA